jgi:DNA polymerase-2
MDERIGWLLDLYADPAGGISLWLIADDSDSRLHLWMDFPVTFYAAGDFATLRQAWIFLKDKGVSLARTRRRDLFTGERDVLAVTVLKPADLPGIFGELTRQFPALDYYDTDIPLSLRFAARTGVHLLGRCKVRLDGEKVADIQPLDTPWELDPPPIPLRVLRLSPDVDPAHRPPCKLRVRHEHADYSLSLEPARPLVIGLRAVLRCYDPDLILTDYGDTWLFPHLKIWCRQTGLPLNPNRDAERDVLTRRADSYFAYGQVVYRGAQTHLVGRWHIDRRNALLFSDYGLEGVLEQVHVTCLGVQEMARKSPGAGITAMQMLTALRTGVLVPVQKQQAEATKSLTELVRADRGGLIYQPIIGVHGDVAQIDFASMYPSIMVNHNVSPETVGRVNAPDGLVPQTLRPLLEKRLALKHQLLQLNPHDCRVPSLKARTAALKWLLVVCFGYLGYKNARFGKIESHEAVTALSRELMLQAKEVAEAMDFDILHMYVDSLFVQKQELHQPEDFTPLLEAITVQTGLSIALEGIYRWIAFLPSRADKRVPVPNRYFGVLQDGSIKYRGIEARRRDTAPFIAETQMGILEILAQAPDPDGLKDVLPKAQAFVRKQLNALRTGRVPVEKLLVSQKLSRELGEYSSPSPAARAVQQMQEAGKVVRPGQHVRFLFTLGKPGVRAWDVPDQPDIRCIDVHRYRVLFERAVQTVLAPIQQSVTGGMDNECLYLFPTKKAELLAEGGSQRLGVHNLSPISHFGNAVQGDE